MIIKLQKFKLALENIAKHKEKDINYKLRLLSQSGTIFTRSESGISLIPKSTKDIDEVKEPLALIKDLFNYVPKEDLIEFYEIPMFEDIIEFLENICKKNNFMIKVGKFWDFLLKFFLKFFNIFYFFLTFFIVI